MITVQRENFGDTKKGNIYSLRRKSRPTTISNHRTLIHKMFPSYFKTRATRCLVFCRDTRTHVKILSFAIAAQW